MNKNKEKVKSACEESEKSNIYAIDESDRKARVEKIAHILEAVKYPTSEDRLEAVLSFSRSTLNEQEIEAVVKRLRPDYLEGQIYKRGIQ
jgi:hypothetical protein